MAKSKQVTTDFSTGEISEKVSPRTDLETYKHSVRAMVNCYPVPQGSCTRRQGTRYVNTVKDSTKPVRLIPYIYSRTLSYVLVFNAGVIRFIRNGTYIVDGLGAPIEIAHVFADSELDQIRFAQVGNQMFLTQRNHFPQLLKRIDEINWTIANAVFKFNIYNDQWYENHYLRFKIVGGTTKFVVGDNFTILSPAGTVTDPVPANTGNGTVAAVSFKNSPPTETWTLTCVFVDSSRQEFSVTGSVSGSPISTWWAGDYPSTVCVHEQRLFFGGTETNPQTIWTSGVADYTTLTQGIIDNDAFQFTINSNSNDELVHIVSGQNLMPFTYGGEFTMTGSSTTGLTPTTIRITPYTNHGTNDTTPIKVGSNILFVQRDSMKVRAISYSQATNTNVASDITVLSDTITESGIVNSAFAQSPDYLTWWTKNNGELLSCVYIPDYNMTGWARHNTKDGTFEKLCVVPEAQQDTVYLVVNRKDKDGVQMMKSIEYFDYTTDLYMDCAKDYLASLATGGTITTHLKNQVLTLMQDGQILKSLTSDASGVITTNFTDPSDNRFYQVVNPSGGPVTIGLNYTNYVRLQHPFVGNGLGTSEGGVASIYKIVLRVENTLGCKINDVDKPFRQMSDSLNTQTDLYTGYLDTMNFGSSNAEYTEISQPYPLPWTLVSAIQYVQTND